MTAVTIDHSPRRGRQPEPEARRTYNRCLVGSVAFDPARRFPTISRKEANLRLLALYLQLEKQRQKGRRVGGAGTICEGAARLYKLLLNMSLKHGSRGVHPRADTLAWMLGATEKAIHKWKGQLHDFGFLDWQRQTKPTGLEGIRGPQVEQTSNVYIMKISKVAVDLVAALRKKMGKKADPRTVEPGELAVMSDRARAREERLAARQAAEAAHLRSLFDAPPDTPRSG